MTVERAIEVPARDGITLVTDHYRPQLAGPAPTLLVRSPYGRGLMWDFLYGALFARQGFHVVLQSCRGAGGSGGELDPLRHETTDAEDTMAWLRGQDWFNGELGTVGASYLGYTQWALAASAPPELRAMAVQAGSDDFSTFLFPGGAFALDATLTATALMLSMGRGIGPALRAMTRLSLRLRRAGRTLPLIDAYPPVLGGRAGFVEQWLAHPDLGDPYWTPRRAPLAPDLAVPVSLLSGWRDPFLDPALSAYRRQSPVLRRVRPPLRRRPEGPLLGRLRRADPPGRPRCPGRSRRHHRAHERHRPPVRRRSPPPGPGLRRRAPPFPPPHRHGRAAGHRHPPGPGRHRDRPRPRPPRHPHPPGQLTRHTPQVDQTKSRLEQRYQRDMRRANEVMDRMRRDDPAAWQEYLSELTDFEAGTIGDGLLAAASDWPEYNDTSNAGSRNSDS